MQAVDLEPLFLEHHAEQGFLLSLGATQQLIAISSWPWYDYFMRCVLGQAFLGPVGLLAMKLSDYSLAMAASAAVLDLIRTRTNFF